MTPRQTAINIARQHGLDWDDIRGPRRFPKLMACRRAIAVELRRIGCKLAAIANVLCRKHTTVIHYLRTSTTNKRVNKC